MTGFSQQEKTFAVLGISANGKAGARKLMKAATSVFSLWTTRRDDGFEPVVEILWP